MRFRFQLMIFGLAALVLSACRASSSPQITPAADRLTFLFFYADG